MNNNTKPSAGIDLTWLEEETLDIDEGAELDETLEDMFESASTAQPQNGVWS